MRFRGKECCPYVAIAVPLTAESVRPCLQRRSERVGGIILTCAPVSTRNLILLMRYVIRNRRHMLGPDTSVAANGWPGYLAAG